MNGTIANYLATPFLQGWVLLLLLLSTCAKNEAREMRVASGRAYFVSTSGNDQGAGTKAAPWKSIDRVNQALLMAGDSILLEGGQIFYGQVKVQSNESGTAEHPVIISSYGTGTAVIHGGNGSSLSITGAGYISVSRLAAKGAGRKEGNTENGFLISNAHHIRLENIETSGFQKAGVLVNVCTETDLDHVFAHDNGFAGIHVTGTYGNRDCFNVRVKNSVAANNPGDPTNFTNHSGNGILAGYCRNILIDQCSASENGWDMPRVGNGPVGIWCYEADSVIIQRCISYRNKTSKGGEDGGGFDLDGGVTNTVIQYCLSYENEGSGFGIFQYAGASVWRNNTVRFNVSRNDGSVSPAHAGVYVWNSSENAAGFSGLFFYNNIIYNETGAAIAYARQNTNSGFKFYNNIFLGKDTLIRGSGLSADYAGNDWWSIRDTFNVGGIRSLEQWSAATGKERLNGKIVGWNVFPKLKDAAAQAITNPLLLSEYDAYVSHPGMGWEERGLDLRSLFGIDRGQMDFNQRPLKIPAGIGASFP